VSPVQEGRSAITSDTPNRERALFSHPPTEQPQEPENDSKSPPADHQIAYDNLFREPANAEEVLPQ
jgi:hypothetical protein